MTSRAFRSVFWDDLEADLEDPAFRDSYTQATAEISEADRAVNDRVAAEANTDFLDSDAPASSFPV